MEKFKGFFQYELLLFAKTFDETIIRENMAVQQCFQIFNNKLEIIIGVRLTLTIFHIKLNSETL